jgi:mannosyl-3-phosphoglycerate phosphatase family protein
MYIVFTDIDGTLIEHHNYDYSIAKNALKILKKYKIPVIFCSSKTFDEQTKLQNELGLSEPFIIENGSAIVIPKNYFSHISDNQIVIDNDYTLIILSKKTQEEIRLLKKYLEEKFNLSIFGFAEADDDHINVVSGLEGENIKKAKNKLFTETIIFPKLFETQILNFINRQGFQVSQGGRFLTIQDTNVNKGKAIKKILEIYEQNNLALYTTIGIGDNYNDIAMLEVVDKPFLVQKFDGNWVDITIKNLEKVPAIGPAGFEIVAKKIVSDLL